VFGGAVLRELPDGDDDAEAEARAEAGKIKKKSKKKGAKIDKKLENVSGSTGGRLVNPAIKSSGALDLDSFPCPIFTPLLGSTKACRGVFRGGQD